MAESEPQPWEQLPDEPNECYVRFLIYRNLGPGRTVDLAYNAYVAQMPTDPAKVPKGKPDRRRRPTPKPGTRASSSWWENSREHEWQQRATAWDIYTFKAVVPDGAIAIMHVVAETAKVALRALQTGTLKPTSWGELINGVELLTSFISADAVHNLLGGGAGPALPAGDAGDGETAVDASEGAANGRPQ